ncbi:MAG: pilus assembly protein TadG-related protein [Actinobacteria bacterium]|nr:pilus assembly protein TadG-related protein [Actinomycetota bacterium]
MTSKKIFKNKSGNISIFTIILIFIFALLFLLIIDFSRIFTAREITKNASDAAALAVAQNILFFENSDYEETVIEVLKRNNCFLDYLDLSYDEITVAAGKEMKFLLIDKFFPGKFKIKSESEVKILYPWDDFFAYCKFYEFNH